MNYLKLFAIATFAVAAILYMASSEEHTAIVGEQDYDLGKFVKISVNISTDMKVQVGEEYSLDVKADVKDLKNIKVFVKGHTLVIKSKKPHGNSWYGDTPEIRITLPLLKKFTINGASDVEIQGIHGSYFVVIMNGNGNIDFEGNTEELVAVINGSGSLTSKSYGARESKVEINGSGSVDLSGKCKTLEVEINGSGDFDAKDYKCKEVEVRIIGSGDLKVNASLFVGIDVTGSGDVDVYGDPKYVKDRSYKKNHEVTIH